MMVNLKKGILLATLTFVSLFGFANVDVSSPQKAVRNHSKHIQDDDAFKPKLAIQSFDTTGYSEAELIKLAIQLRQVFDGIGEEIALQNIPNDSNYVDEESGNHVYNLFNGDSITFINIYLEKKGDKWLYSSETIKKIPEYLRDVYPFGIHKVLGLFPRTGATYFGLHMSQLVGLFILIFISFVIHKVLSFILKKVLVQAVLNGLTIEGDEVSIGQKRLKLSDILLKVAKPISLLVVFYVLSILFPVLQLNLSITAKVSLALRSTMPILATVMLYRMVDILSFYLWKLAEKSESKLDDQLVPLLRKVLKVFVVAIGSLFTLQNLHFDVTALLAGLSIGGLAIALAAQDMLKNFFGSIMIFIDKPFQIGDWIVGNGLDGDVEEVGFRSTKVRTFHNSLVSIPNGQIADMTIDNMGMRKYRRYKTYVGVTYDTPAYVLDGFVEGLRTLVREHPNTWKNEAKWHVYVNSFNSSSIDIIVYVFFDVPNWKEELKARHEFNLSIIRLAEHMGVRFAFPTQTIHIEDFPEKKGATPESLKNEVAVKESLTGFSDK
jgi:MscS family membrane protein